MTSLSTMPASGVSGNETGEGPPSDRSSPVEASKLQHIDQSISECKLKPDDADSPSNAPATTEDSIVTPKASVETTVRALDEPATPSSSSEMTAEAKSADTSPLTIGAKSADASPLLSAQPAQPVVSHLPESVQQPLLPPSEQSADESPSPLFIVQPIMWIDGDIVMEQQQQQQQWLTREGNPAVSLAPAFKVRGTQGQVVTKQKGRFRLLQNAPIIEYNSETTGSNSEIAAGSAATGVGGEATQAPPPDGAEGGAVPTHPSREMSLSNASSLSAMSVPSGGIGQMPMVMNSEPWGIPQVNGAPAVKKKGRFVVIPGDVTDPSLLGRKPIVRQITPTGQLFPGQQGAPSKQLVHSSIVTDAALGSDSQRIQSTIQPLMTVQDGAYKAQVGQGSEQRHCQPSTHASQYATSVAGTVMSHAVTQAPQYYAAAPHVQIGTPQAVQLSFPQHPAATQTQPGAPHSTQPSQLPSMETEEIRHHHAVSVPQHIAASVDSYRSSGIGQQAPIPQEMPLPQHHAHSQSVVAVLPTALGDTVKPAQAAKNATAKCVKRLAGAKGTQTNVGFGKVLYFLDQMKLEVTEADRTIKEQESDMKFLREKNKELEAKSRDMEKKWLEEKASREALEAKVKSLKKKVKELKGSMEASNVNNIKEVDEKFSEVAELIKPQAQSRNNSMDGLESLPSAESSSSHARPDAAVALHKSDMRAVPNGEKKEVPTVVEKETIDGNSGQRVPIATHTVMTEKNESKGIVDTKPAAHRTSGAPTNVADQRGIPQSISMMKESMESTTQLKATALFNASKTPTPVTAILRERSLSGERFEVMMNSVPLSMANPVNGGKGTHNRSSSLSFVPHEALSPPRRQIPKEVAGDMFAMGKYPSIKSLPSGLVPQTVQCQGNGLVNTKLIAASSGDSLGSASEFDPLRVGPPIVAPIQALLRSKSSDVQFLQQVDFDPLGVSHTVPPGQTLLPPTSSDVAFTQEVDFDPLGVSHDRGNRDECAHTVASEKQMPIVQSSPQHIQSQSMPNFALQQNGMTMAYPVQQIDMQLAGGANLSHQIPQGWNQYQQPVVPGQQSQYIPTQFTVLNAAAAHQQPSTDPFAELASRRAPGNAGHCGLQQQPHQQQQQAQKNWKTTYQHQ